MTIPTIISSRPIILHNHEKTILTITLLLFLLLGQPAQAQPNPPGSDVSPYAGQKFSPSMGVIIIVLIAALFFMGFFSIYIRHCSDDTSARGGGARSRRVLNGSVARSRRTPRGLDQAVIESFPTFDYGSVKTAKIGKGALECAVCLTEFEDDDTLRLIPKCDHVFHPECIDTWLTGHTTCPVCRANLTDLGEWSVHSPGLENQDEVVLEVNEESHDQENNNVQINNANEENESMEQPLHGRIRRNRSMMRNVSFGRPRWMAKFTRSFSTGHVAFKQWENTDRFTLRLPVEVRKQVMSGKLERSKSLVVLPRETSSRRGYRTGFEEGTSRGRSGSVRSDRAGRSDRWIFSLAPPFFSRAPSLKSPKVVAAATLGREGSFRSWVRDGSVRGSVRAEPTRLPV